MTDLDSPHRVLIIPPSYFDRDRTVGGGERYAFEYAKAMAARSPTTFGLFGREARESLEGDLVCRTFSIGGYQQWPFFPLTRESRRLLRSFHLIHLFAFPTPLADSLIVRSRIQGRRLILTDVGGEGRCWSTYLKKLHPRADLNRWCHGLALLSRHASRFFSTWPQPKTVLFGGVDPVRFRPSAAPPEGYVLYVGRLLPHKGVRELIQALPSTIPLRIAGRPYDRDYFESLKKAAATKDVRFHLELDDEELRELYRRAQVVVQPSLPLGSPDTDKSELLGLTTLEAMACGRPVIVTQTGSLPELVDDGKTGFVVAPGDPEGLRARIELLVQDRDLGRRLGDAGRKRVEKDFTWSKAAERGWDLYQRVLRMTVSEPSQR